MVDTNDYIFRFLNGEISNKRKHSEVINKILAGYIDSDGYIELARKDGLLAITVSLGQAAVNDPDFTVLRRFHEHYGLGSLTYRFSKSNKESSRCDWRLGVKDTLILFNLIGKHLIIKGKPYKNLISLFNSFKGTKISSNEWDELRNIMIEIKKDTGPIKRKKHPSWAWLAGYIAGDGHLCCRLGRKRKKFDKKVNKYYNMTYNELYVVITGDDRNVFEFLQEHFKGSVYNKGTYYQWKRSLGKGHLSFSKDFLRRIKPYMLHPKKYKTIKRMQSYYKGLAETKQVELEIAK